VVGEHTLYLGLQRGKRKLRGEIPLAFRGVGRGGHSRRLHIFVRQAGRYAKRVDAQQIILRERATVEDATVGLWDSLSLKLIGI
jgi:hypothetical protein